ncbi:LOW QUALITY PROTEIN: Carnosine N-methyltransferase [Plecturocebus cupreus]
MAPLHSSLATERGGRGEGKTGKMMVPTPHPLNSTIRHSQGLKYYPHGGARVTGVIAPPQQPTPPAHPNPRALAPPLRHRDVSALSSKPAANERRQHGPSAYHGTRMRAGSGNPEDLAEPGTDGGLRVAGAERAASWGHVRGGRRLEEGQAAATTLSVAARRKRARPRSAAAMQRRRRPPPPASRLPEGSGGGRGGSEEVEVQFSAGRWGSAAGVSAAAAAATRSTEEEEERLEREHFWKIINAFRYYG